MHITLQEHRLDEVK